MLLSFCSPIISVVGSPTIFPALHSKYYQVYFIVCLTLLLLIAQLLVESLVTF